MQLHVDLALRRLSIFDGLGLERLDGFELLIKVVGGGLEGTVRLLNLVDDGLVLEDGAVMTEIDFLRGFGEDGDLAANVLVALLEGLEGGNCLSL